MGIITRYDYDTRTETSGAKIISEAEARLARKKIQLDDVQYEYDLVERDTYNSYRSIVNYLALTLFNASQVSLWCTCLKTGFAPSKDGRKIDKRRKYEEKTAYEMLTSTLEKYLGIEGLVITSLSDYNFGEAWIVYFTYLDHEWTLSIPRVERVGFKSYKTWGSRVFMLRLGYKSGCVDDFVGETFDEEKLSGIMKLGIEKFVQGEILDIVKSIKESK